MADIIKLDGTRQLDFDREMVEQAYDRWAPVYDLVFGGVFSKGRKAAIQATNKIGGRVLEVGYAFAEPAYIAALVEADPGELVGIDLAEAEVPGFETAERKQVSDSPAKASDLRVAFEHGWPRFVPLETAFQGIDLKADRRQRR